MAEGKSGYDLSRKWFDFCFDNPEKIKPNHTALYFFAIEHCNRLGWKDKFGLPTTMAKEAIGIRSYNTYINTLNDLIEWGFIEMIERSKNQYSSNIIALSNFDKALNKALDKALIKHGTKQSESTSESIGSINKQENNKQLTKQREKKDPRPLIGYQTKNFEIVEKALEDQEWSDRMCKRFGLPRDKLRPALEEFSTYLFDTGTLRERLNEFKKHFVNNRNASKRNGTGTTKRHKAETGRSNW